MPHELTDTSVKDFEADGHRIISCRDIVRLGLECSQALNQLAIYDARLRLPVAYSAQVAAQLVCVIEHESHLGVAIGLDAAVVDERRRGSINVNVLVVVRAIEGVAAWLVVVSTQPDSLKAAALEATSSCILSSSESCLRAVAI